MTVRENVQVALLSHHRRAVRPAGRAAAALYRDEADALLERVGMASQAERACGVLAYGDLKRVELAMALANAPAPAADGRADRRHGAARSAAR